MSSSLFRPSAVIALGVLATLTSPALAQQFESFDTYAANSQVVGQGGWEEWGAGAGAVVSSAQALSASNSIDIKASSDLIHQYSGYTSGTWVYTAWQYIPSTFTGKTYFILLNKYASPSGPYSWSVEVAFNKTTGKVEADAGGLAGGATANIVYDKWVEIKCVIRLDDDWVQVYYDGNLLDDPLVPDHPTHGGGYIWTKGPFGNNTTGTKNIGAVDLFANGATSVYYDQISLARADSWHDGFDTYPAAATVVGKGGWEEWGAGAGANVSTTQSRSGANSIDIMTSSDLVHQYTGATSGVWEYTAWQYIPSTFTGKTYFILLNTYTSPSGPYSWSVEVAFNKTTGKVEADAGGLAGGATANIVYDKWVQIQCVIDFDADWVQVYYDGVLLDDPLVADHPILGGGHSWTKGPFGNNTTGVKNIGAVDLFANGASSVFYDDLSLRRAAKGVRRYGKPTAGTAGNPQMYALDDAVAPSTTFGIAGRGAASSVGFLAFSAGAIPQGLPLLGINVLIDPNTLVLAGVSTDATGGHSINLPLLATYTGAKVFAQYIWDEPNTTKLSASNALEINVR